MPCVICGLGGVVQPVDSEANLVFLQWEVEVIVIESVLVFSVVSDSMSVV